MAALAALLHSLRVEERLRRLEDRLSSLPPVPAAGPAALEPEPVLSGLRILVQVAQDHPRRLVESLIRDALLAEDAAMTEEEPDLEVRGEVQCNGYAEVFYKAEIQVLHRGQTLCSLSLRPPNGDRPANLVQELTALIRAELAKKLSRGERIQAILELEGRE